MSLRPFKIPFPLKGMNRDIQAVDPDAQEANSLWNMSLFDFRSVLGGELGEGPPLLRPRKGLGSGQAVTGAGAVAEYATLPFIVGADGYLIHSGDGEINALDVVALDNVVLGGTVTDKWVFATMPNSANVDHVWAMGGPGITSKKWDGTTFADWANSPPQGLTMEVWKNRMCIGGVSTNPERLFFSDIGNPESPAATYGTNWVDIRAGEDKQDGIVALKALGDNLLVFKERSIWLVYDQSTFANRRIASGMEIRHNDLNAEGRGWDMAELGGRIFFIDKLGQLWSISSDGELMTHRAPRFTGSSIRAVITWRSQLWIQSIGGTYAQGWLVGDDIVWATGVFGSFGDYPLLKIVPPDESEPSYLAVWNPDGAGAVGTFHFMDNASEAEDGGVDFSAQYITPWIKFVGEEKYERLRRLNIIHEGPFQIHIWTDFSIVTDRFVASVAGVAPHPFDEGIPVVTRLRPEVRGRYFKIRIQSTNGDLFKYHGMEAMVRGGKEH